MVASGSGRTKAFVAAAGDPAGRPVGSGLRSVGRDDEAARSTQTARSASDILVGKCKSAIRSLLTDHGLSTHYRARARVQADQAGRLGPASLDGEHEHD